MEVVPKRANTGGTYDLWETDFTPKVDLENKAAGEHILRATKKKLPQKPSRLRSKPSLLRAVALPAPGVSYNPTAEDYQVCFCYNLMGRPFGPKDLVKLLTFHLRTPYPSLFF